MVLRFLVLWLGLGLAGSSVASELTPEAESAWGEMAKVKSLTARFTQTQHRAVLSKPMVSSGTLAFARPGQLRWQVEEPTPSIYIMVGQRVGIYYPSLGLRQEADLAEQPDALRVVTALFVWLSGDLMAVRRDYNISMDGGIITLRPKGEELRLVLSRFELTPADGHFSRVVLHESQGDRVEIALSDVRLDPALGPDAFVLPSPE